MENIKLIYVDLFCGAGGVSTGIEHAKLNGSKCCVVAACCNHDFNAIRSHHDNHPHVTHYREDIRTLDLTDMIDRVDALKAQYPDAKVVLWASLECTNFSRAKGGRSRSQDSRTLANHLFRYIDAINPDAVQIENVEEFMLWGPEEPKIRKTKDGLEYCETDLFTDEDGKTYLVPVMVPVKDTAGETYSKWTNTVKERGYEYKFDIINSADFGGYTTRIRFFGVFYKKEVFNFNFPNPMDVKAKKAIDVIDENEKMKSLFSKPKCLVKNTISGYMRGIERHKEYLMTTTNPKLCYMQYGNSYTVRLDRPIPTITTNPKHNLLSFSKLSGEIEVVKNVDNGKVTFHVYAPGNAPVETPIFYFDGVDGVVTIPDNYPDYYIELIETMLSAGIYDIKYRRLSIVELKRLMGFPDEYILHGSMEAQMKYIGNAVDVNISKLLAETTANSFRKSA